MYQTGGAIDYDNVDDALNVTLPIISDGRCWMVIDDEITIWPINKSVAGSYRMMRADCRGYGFIDRALTVDEIGILESYYGATATEYAFVAALRGGTSAYLDIDAVGGITVDWGDGAPESIASGVATTHTYSSSYAGLVRVSASNAITSLDLRAGTWCNTTADLPSGITYLLLSSSTSTWSGSAMPWRTANMRFVRIEPGLTEDDVDNILIALAMVTSWTQEKLVDLDAVGNAARTSASDAAVATIEGYGVTVQTA